jgi:hypothetical protein
MQLVVEGGPHAIPCTHRGQVIPGLTRRSPWDDLQVASFAGEANWNYFAAPFILARSDIVGAETEPWHEDEQVWRRLLVTYPGVIVAHTRQQTCYFDDACLLRRLGYAADILGGGPAVGYPSEYREFDGIMVPTRRLYVRNPTAPGPGLGLDRHRHRQRHLQLGGHHAWPRSVRHGISRHHDHPRPGRNSGTSRRRHPHPRGRPLA